jgi:hypothetical protein
MPGDQMKEEARNVIRIREMKNVYKIVARKLNRRNRSGGMCRRDDNIKMTLK